jgi:hypothetical protein
MTFIQSKVLSLGGLRPTRQSHPHSSHLQKFGVFGADKNGPLIMVAAEPPGFEVVQMFGGFSCGHELRTHTRA